MYEFLIATGRDKNASTNKKVEMALIYNENGSEKISDYFQPGNYSNRNDAFENGQLDICAHISVEQGGSMVFTDDIVGVMVKFHDETWQLDTIWVTHESGGRCRYKEVNEMFGSHSNLGTPNNPYRIDFEPDTVGNKGNENSFILSVKTAAGNNNGTNDNVFFKLFDDAGYASQTSRADIPGNQYEAGETNTIPSFNTVFGNLTKKISKVLIVKVGNDKWVPEYIKTTSGLVGQESEFSVINHLPPEGSLDTNHNWTIVPEKNAAVKNLAPEGSLDTQLS